MSRNPLDAAARAMVRVGVSIVVALTASGCYESNALLLRPEEAVRPVQDGVWRTSGGRVRLASCSERTACSYRLWWIDSDFDTDAHRVYMTKFSDYEFGTVFYVAVESHARWFYSFLDVRPQSANEKTPNCAMEEDRTTALSNKATIERDSNVCIFTDKESLRDALAGAGRRWYGLTGPQ